MSLDLVLSQDYFEFEFGLIFFAEWGLDLAFEFGFGTSKVWVGHNVLLQNWTFDLSLGLVLALHMSCCWLNFGLLMWA